MHSQEIMTLPALAQCVPIRVIVQIYASANISLEIFSNSKFHRRPMRPEG